MPHPSPLSRPRYDVAVVGLGAAGSSALRFLALSGASAIGIDRYAPPHALGSSHGETRLCRVSHAEGEAYAPLMKRAIALWQEIECANKVRLLEPTGILYAGPTSGEFTSATLAAAHEHNVPAANLSVIEARALDAALHLKASWVRFLEAPSGFLYPERAIETMLAEARTKGATICTNLEAQQIDVSGAGADIVTPSGTLRASMCILAAGGWAASLVPDFRPTLHTSRRTLHWFADPRGLYSLRAGFKPFIFETDEGRLVYGFPDVGTGVKVAEHVMGAGANATMDCLDRTASCGEQENLRQLALPYLPHLGAITRSAVCAYPMSIDEHFVLGRHPARERLILGVGLSGHGFKFAPVIGEALAALALERVPAIDLAPFSPGRFAC